MSPSSSRNTAQPWGGARGRPLTKKEELANRILEGCVRLARACDRAGTAWIWENPASSLQWLMPSLARLAENKHGRPPRRTVIFDWCRFGRPWRKATKIVTHDKYSFYNPKQHPYFSAGRFLFLEGTYTHTFSGNTDQTPRYDYNQIMYRLNLDDQRLHHFQNQN